MVYLLVIGSFIGVCIFAIIAKKISSNNIEKNRMQEIINEQKEELKYYKMSDSDKLIYVNNKITWLKQKVAMDQIKFALNDDYEKMKELELERDRLIKSIKVV